MRKESSSLNTTPQGIEEENRRREALEVLLEARERLLTQLTEDILSHSESILDRSQNGLLSFEFQEIEDRYSARLNALNSLLEHLEYRQPLIRHKVETITTTPRTLKKDLTSLVNRFEQWDLVDLELLRLEGEQLLVVAALTTDEYPE